MDIVQIQALIAKGKVVSSTDIDPTQSFVQIGVYQPDNRKIGSANNTYPPFVIPLSELTNGSTWGTITGLLANQLDLQAALDAKYDITNPDSFIDITALAPYQLALGFTPEDVANKDIDGTLSANSNTLYSSQRAVKTYVDSSVVGVLDDRGNWDASSGLFPSTGGSGPLGTILKGDLWFVDVPGILGGNPVVVGSNFRALIDNPVNPTDWNILNVGLGYIPENIANKGISNGYASLDATGKVPASQSRYKVVMKHGYNNTTNFGAIGSPKWYYFGGLTSLGIPAALSSNPANTLSGRQSLVQQTGTITSAKFNWYVSSNINAGVYKVTIRNRTTNTSYVITNTFPLGTSIFQRVLNVPGLSIPVNENDEVFTVIECPALVGVIPANVYMDIDYIIE